MTSLPKRRLNETEIAREVNRILARAQNVPDDEKMKYVQKELKPFDDMTRIALENLVIFGKRLEIERPVPVRELLYIGLVSLVLAIAAASMIPNLPTLSHKLIAVFGALAAGCVSAALPGAMKLKTTVKGIRIDATAAVAVFALVLILLLRS